MSYWKAYKLGMLPDEGSIGSQSARGWKLLSIMDSYMAEAEGIRLKQLTGKN